MNGQVGHLLAREVSSDFDEFHRARRVTHLDGTFEDTTYACCGVETSTARDGVVTTYLYAPESKRQYGVLRGGVVTASDVDAAGRTTREWRLGTDDSEMTLRGMGYDTAGQLTRETNALNGVTSYTNYVDGSGHSVRVTTDPAGGQRIETAYRDGSPMSVTGSGAFPVWHEYGAYSGGTWSKETKGGSGGSEWVKTYSDLLGRTWKTEYPGGAISTNGYSAIGQLEKAVDADGVTTLYTYDAQGRAEKTIVDMNRNGVGTASVDRVSRTTNDVVQVGSVVYRRTRSYQTADGGSEVLTGESLSSADGNTTVSLAYGLGTTNLTVFDAANLRRTNITVQADGSKSVSIY